MDEICKGIINSKEHNEKFKEQLFKVVFNNLEESNPGFKELKIFIDWIVSSNNRLLVKTGHEQFRRFSLINMDGFYQLVGPKFIVDLYSNNYPNKADIVKVSKTILDILKSKDRPISENQDEVDRAIFNIVKCQVPRYIREHGIQMPVMSNMYDLLISYPYLLPQGPEVSRLTNCIVKYMAVYKLSPSTQGDLEKISKLLPVLLTSEKDCQESVDGILKTLYAIISTSDSYDKPSPALMMVINKIPAFVMSKATEYFVNDSLDPQGEARVVMALQTMINWLMIVSNVFVSKWISKLLESLKEAGRYPVLIELTHSTIEGLCLSMAFPHLQSSTESIFLFLFLGFQHSETAFHRLLSPLTKVLPKLKNSQNSKSTKLYDTLCEAVVFFSTLFPNYPGLYDHVLSLIDVSKHKLSEERAGELKKLSWLNKFETLLQTTSSRSENGMLGLMNLGNTCYMNSILQSLFLTKQFCDLVLTSSLTPSQIVLHRLQLVFTFLKLSIRSVYSPVSFLKVARPPWFEAGRQQDCSEFLRYLLDTLHETEKQSRKTGDRVARDMSESLRSYSTSALNSIEETDREAKLRFVPDSVEEESNEDPSNKYSLEPKLRAESDSDFTMGSSNSLNSQDNMKRWTTQENLSMNEDEEDEMEEENDSGIQSVGDSISGSSDSMQQNEDFVSLVQRVFGGKLLNSYNCKNCSTVSVHRESFTDINLALPKSSSHPVTVQSLLDSYLEAEILEGENQYHCDVCGGLQDAEKTSKFQESPTHLTCTLMRFHYDREAKRRSKIFTEIQYEKTLQFPLSSGTTDVYELYSVVFHSGYGSDSGHYYCFGRKIDIDNDDWYNFNDSHVSLIKFESLREMSKTFPRDTPYVLFYRKKGVDPLTTETERPLRPDLKAAVEKDNRIFLMDKRAAHNRTTFPRFDDYDDRGGPGPSSCSGSGLNDLGGGRFIY